MERKPWQCDRSPTSAHHWVIQGRIGQCKYCLVEREFPLGMPTTRATPVLKTPQALPPGAGEIVA